MSAQTEVRRKRIELACGHVLEAKDYPGRPSYVYCQECRAFRWVKRIV